MLLRLSLFHRASSQNIWPSLQALHAFQPLRMFGQYLFCYDILLFSITVTNKRSNFMIRLTVSGASAERNELWEM